MKIVISTPIRGPYLSIKGTDTIYVSAGMHKMTPIMVPERPYCMASSGKYMGKVIMPIPIHRTEMQKILTTSSAIFFYSPAKD